MTNRDVVISYLRSFASGSPEAVAAHVSTDFENDQPGELGAGCRGAAAYRQRLAAFLNDFSELRYEIVDLIAAEDQVAVSYRMTCTHEGHAIDIPGVMMITLRDGLIVARSDYWDGLTFLRQTGAYP